MKKILSIAVASIAVAAIANPFSPDIGVTTLSLSAKNNVIPVQFTSLSTGNNTISADELVCTNNIPQGSYLYVFTDNSYKAWYLGNTGWVAPAYVGDGVGELGEVPAATGLALSAGTAIWLSFPSAPSPSPVTVSVYGANVANVTSQIVAGKSNLIGNPGDAVSLTGKLNIEAKKGDKIFVLGSDSATDYYSYGTEWMHVTFTAGKPSAEPGLPTIPRFGGFWYISTGSSNGTVTW